MTKKKMNRKLSIQFWILIILIVGLAIYLTIKYPAFKAEEIVNLNIESDATTAQISKNIYGSQVLPVDMGNGILKKTLQKPGIEDVVKRPLEFDQYVLSKAKEANLNFLRWGYDSIYDWRAGIGPISSRPKRSINVEQDTNQNYEQNVFGTDELVWFARELNPEIDIVYTFSAINGKDMRRWFENGDWEQDVERSIQSAANLVEYSNVEATQTAKNNFNSGVWEPTTWSNDPDPNKTEIKVTGKSWYSWEKAPVGYFAGLRWHFSQLRAQEGEIYLVDGAPYNINYWEYGNEIQYSGPTRWQKVNGNKPWAQPHLYGQNFIRTSDAMKAIDPDIKLSLSAWMQGIGNDIRWNEGYIWNSGSKKIKIKSLNRDNNGLVTVETDGVILDQYQKAFASGNLVKIQGLPDSSLNGYFTVKVDHTDVFEIGSIVRNEQKLVTVTTRANHNFSTDQTIHINSAVDTTFNGDYKITKISDNAFTYAQSSDSLTPISYTMSTGYPFGVASLVIKDSATIIKTFTFLSSSTTPVNIADSAMLEKAYASIEGVFGPVNKITSIVKGEQTVVNLADLNKATNPQNTSENKLSFAPGDIIEFESMPETWSSLVNASVSQRTIASISGNSITLNFNSSSISADGIGEGLVAIRSEAFKSADNISLHEYIDSGVNVSRDQTEYDALAFGLNKSPYASDNTSAEGYIIKTALLKQYIPKPILMTEYGTQWGVQGARGEKQDMFRLKSGLGLAYLLNGYLKIGLSAGSIFHLSANSAWGDPNTWKEKGLFNNHDLWRLINVHEIIDSENPANSFSYLKNTTPNYHVISLYSKYINTQLVNTTLSNNSDKRLDAIVAKQDENINVAITNIDATNYKTVSINFEDYYLDAQVEKYILNTKPQNQLNSKIISRLGSINGQANLMEASNEFVNETGIAIDTEIAGVKNETVTFSNESANPNFVYSVPPHSLTILRFKYNSSPSPEPTFTERDTTLPTSQFVTGTNMVSFPQIKESSFTFMQNGSFSPSASTDPKLSTIRPKIFQYIGSNTYSRYDPTKTTDGYSNFAPTLGKGYFMRVFENESLANIKYYTQSTNSVSLDLLPEWNLLGNPFTTNLDPNKFVFTYNGQTKTYSQAISEKLILDYFYSWERSINAYKFITTNPKYNNQPNLQSFIDPYRGYWLYSRVSGLKIEMKS